MRKKLMEKRRGKYAIHERKSIEEIDSILEQKYKYGLINFAESLKGVLDYRIFNPLIAGPAPTYSNLTTLINSLKKVKERIIKSFESYYKHMPFSMYEGEYNVFNRYKIGSVLELIDVEIQFYKRLNELNGKAHKGGPKVQPITLLTYVWSHFMRDKRGVHWDQIEGLLYWFIEKLKNNPYKLVLEQHISDWATIKRKVLRLRRTKWKKTLNFTFVEFFKRYEKIMSKKEQSEIIENLFKKKEL
jgi:hypothetical protein